VDNIAHARDELAILVEESRAFLARRWWAIALRGLLAPGFGVLCLAHPRAALMSLVELFAAYAIADGIAAMIAAASAARGSDRWLLLAVEALVSMGAGLFALLLPHLTMLVFMLVIGMRAAISGVLLMMSSHRLLEGRGLMALAGFASVILAVALFSAPMIGAQVLTWWIGAYALMFGILQLLLAFRLHGLFQSAFRLD
jgi:uncharacterized membrane protein HdeD (DUF308 family)